MLVSWFIDDQLQQCMIDCTQLHITILGHQILFVLNDNKYFMKLPYDCHSDEHVIDKDMIVTLQIGNQSIQVCFTFINDTRKHTHYYRVNQSFEIFTHDDVSHDLPTDKITIHPELHTIEVENNIWVSLNQKRIWENATYSFSDICYYRDIWIVFLENGICTNLDFQNDPKFTPLSHSDFEVKPLLPMKKIIHPIECSLLLHPEYVVHVDLPSFTYEQNQRPLFMNIGPTLTMSLATCSIGILSAYRTYYRGGSTLDILPSLVFPFTMIISCIVWGFANHFYEKHQYKMKYRKYKREYDYLRADQIDKIRQEISRYSHDSSLYYPYMDKLCTAIIQNEEVHLHPEEERYFVRIGLKKDVFRLIDEKQILSNDMPIVQQKLPWIMNVKECHRLCVLKGQESNQFLQYIVIQLVTYSKVRICFYVDEDIMNENPWLLYVPNTIYKNQRLLVNDNGTFLQLQKDEAFLDFVHIVLDGNCERHFPQEATVIYFVREYENPRYKQVLDFDNRLYHDYENHKNESFETNFAKNIDMIKVLSRFPMVTTPQRQANNGLIQLFGSEDVEEINILERWQRNRSYQHLCAKLGYDEEHRLISIDLNERADGPHGLIAGMTGSGKSELIITMIMSLAMEYSPRDVQFAIIDFKGGGVGAALTSQFALPHIAGIVSNLDENQIERSLVSFQNECLRREKLFLALSKHLKCPIVNLKDYRMHWRKEYGFDELAELVIVVDEFAELKKQYPEFLHDLISISRIGRSLGIHLILATQKPSGVVSDEIWSNCSFFVCLKVATKNDSYEMLHHDGASLLQGPGSFILRTPQGESKGIAAYASQPYYRKKTHVQLCDINLKIQKDSHFFLEQYETQINDILRVMSHLQYDAPYPLWLPSLTIQDKLHMDNPYEIAKADDYYHHEQIPVCLTSGFTHFVVSKYVEEKQNFFQTILFSLFTCMEETDELFVIDDLFMQYREMYLKAKVWCAYLQSDEEEKINNLFSYLRCETHSVQITLIITDLKRFFYQNEKNYDRLKELLQEAINLKIRIILFASNADLLHFKELSSIEKKYVLKTDDSSEIQQMFMTSKKKIVNQSYFGLCQFSELLEFRFYRIGQKKLHEITTLMANEYGIQKNYEILCMPNEVDGLLMGSEGIPLGIYYDNYQPCTLKPDCSLYVVGYHQFELKEYFQIMQKYCHCEYDSYEDKEDVHLVFCTFDNFQKYVPNDVPFLFVGQGFQEQFLYRQVNEKLNKNEGMYIHENVYRKVRLLDV